MAGRALVPEKGVAKPPSVDTGRTQSPFHFQRHAGKLNESTTSFYSQQTLFSIVALFAEVHNSISLNVIHNDYDNLVNLEGVVDRRRPRLCEYATETGGRRYLGEDLVPGDTKAVLYMKLTAT